MTLNAYTLHSDFGELFRCMAEVEGDEMEEVPLPILV